MKFFSSLKAKAESFLDQYKQKDPATFAAAQQAVGGLLILDGFIGIDNPFEGKKRPGIFGTLGGILVGIIFIFIPTILNNVTGVGKMTATTTATVVSVGAPVVTQTNNSNSSSNSSSTSSSCSITAKYVVDGKEYNQTSSISSSSNCQLTAGQTININYNPQNPSAWTNDAKTMKLVSKIFFWAGIFAVIVSLITFGIRLFSIIFGWKLLQDGRALEKTIPNNASLADKISQIKKEFSGSVFGGQGNTAVNVIDKLTNNSNKN